MGVCVKRIGKLQPTHSKFKRADKDENKLADDVLQHSGSVLICWEHNNIIKIVVKINEKYPISNYVELKKHPWPDIFNLVWVLDYDHKQNQYT